MGLDPMPTLAILASILPSEDQGLCTFFSVLNFSHRPSDILELAINVGSFGLGKACRIWEFEQLVHNNVLIHFFLKMVFEIVK